MTEEPQPHQTAPEQENEELTDAQLAQVAGGGGDSTDGTQPTGSYR
jgi:hypothetical protein